MKQQKLEIDLPIEINGYEIGSVLIKATYTPGIKGRYSGAPEDCYPAEPPDLEIDNVILDKHDCPQLIDLIYGNDKLMDDILMQAEEDIQAEVEAHIVARYEQRMER